MQEIKLNFIDKSEWGPGEWQDEPDKIQYKDEKTGYDCLIKRTEQGFLCGYVGVRLNHTAYGVGYSSFEELCNKGEECDTSVAKKLELIEVHGKLTYSDFCETDNKEFGICHITDNEDKIWWLGFDCGQRGDYIPNERDNGMLSLRMMNEMVNFFTFTESSTAESTKEVYRNVNYVKNEIKSLALQLSELEKNND